MLEQKFLDRFDMERRIQSRLYCFGSGATDEGEGGDDSPAADDTQANYEQEAFGGPRSQTDGVNFRSAPSQPREERDPVLDIVTMGRPMSEPPPVLDTPLRRDIAESMFQDFAATLPPAPAVSPVRTGVGLGGRGTITSVVPQRVSTSYFGDLAGDGMSPTFRDVSVGEPNLPPSAITDLGGEVFDTTSGELIAGDASYFGDLGGSNDAQAAMVPMNSAPVPVPPPPRFQTNAQRDFYENLAGQGDAAMNQFLAEVRNLDNRGFLGSQIAAGIGADGVPNFDTSFPAGSQIRGVTTTNFVDLPVIGTIPVSTYTGLDNPNASSDTSSDETVPPVTNPLTGRDQCPDGYVFDEDLQACRRKTKRELQADNGTGGDSSRPAGDMFFRRTSLDDAPANLPSGFDFDAANRAFTQSFAVRPSFFQRPPDLTGFTLL